MYICRECGAHVDAGELHNGICEDCIEKQEEQAQERCAVQQIKRRGLEELKRKKEALCV